MSFNESYPAVPDSVPRMRQELTAFALEAGANEQEVERITLVVSEAATNAVVHAYNERPGEIQLTAAVTAGELWVLVADDGCGMRRRSDRPGIGMGLALIARCSDEFALVRRSTGGTEVRMRFRLSGKNPPGAGQPRGSVSTASAPAASRFSTTT